MGGVFFPSSRMIPERKGNGAGLNSTMLNLTNRYEIFWTNLPLSHHNVAQFRAPKIVLGAPNPIISKALWRAVLMAEMESTMLPVIGKSSKYKTIIIK